MLYITSDYNHSHWAQTQLLSVIPRPIPERHRALMDKVINPQVSQTLQLTSTRAETFGKKMRTTHLINVCLIQQGIKLAQQNMGTAAAVLSQCTARQLRHFFPRNS
jgi:hypothetical protein